jgi:hypothetical protein
MKCLYQSADPDVPWGGTGDCRFDRVDAIASDIRLLGALAAAFSLVVDRGTKRAYFSAERQDY